MSSGEDRELLQVVGLALILMLVPGCKLFTKTEYVPEYIPLDCDIGVPCPDPGLSPEPTYSGLDVPQSAYYCANLDGMADFWNVDPDLSVIPHTGPLWALTAAELPLSLVNDAKFLRWVDCEIARAQKVYECIVSQRVDKDQD